jgi:membrane protease YdiL (CAAX protease family)
VTFKTKGSKDLGIRTDNLLSSLIPYSLLAAVLILGFFLILRTFDDFSVSCYVLWHQLYPSIWILVALSTLQELFFRGYLIFVLKSFSQSVAIVVFIDALLFGAMHLIFPFPAIIFVTAFLGGIAFATTYYYYPNVILSSLVHSVLLMSLPILWYFHLVSF